MGRGVQRRECCLLEGQKRGPALCAVFTGSVGRVGGVSVSKKEIRKVVPMLPKFEKKKGASDFLSRGRERKRGEGEGLT